MRQYSRDVRCSPRILNIPHCVGNLITWYRLQGTTLMGCIYGQPTMALYAVIWSMMWNIVSIVTPPAKTGRIQFIRPVDILTAPRHYSTEVYCTCGTQIHVNGFVLFLQIWQEVNLSLWIPFFFPQPLLQRRPYLPSAAALSYFRNGYGKFIFDGIYLFAAALSYFRNGYGKFIFDSMYLSAAALSYCRNGYGRFIFDDL
nr:uncharacterized protein LOC104120043 [Nicotiana tomentosiformis]